MRTKRKSAAGKRGFCAAACVLAGTLMLASCNTPVGIAPNLRGTYLEHALVTNPNGGGPQVVRFGPPSNWNPSAEN